MFDNELYRWVLTSETGNLWWLVADVLCIGIGSLVFLLLFALLGLRLRVQWLAARSQLSKKLAGKEILGFFHPYAGAGGGGERVLWCAIDAVQREHAGVVCVVYTGSDGGTTGNAMLTQAEERFGVKLKQEDVHFVFLAQRRWVEASSWPRFTMLGQSLGSLVLAHEAICELIPDAMVDSMGYAFTYPLFRLIGGCRVGAYVHYPTISTDMLERVRTRDTNAVCVDAAVAGSSVLSTAKLLYYRVFALMYGHVGSYAEVVMTNSSWTRGHIDELWGIPSERISTVYPPCDTSALAALPLVRSGRGAAGGHLVVSLAQFRPEKDHPLQLRAFARFLTEVPNHRTGDPDQRVRLIVAGGCRDDGDRGRLATLRSLAVELGLREKANEADSDWDVDFRTNIPLEEVKSLLGQAVVGLHTMRDEHFGISVVEFMAAGAIPLAHDSAGPKMDIVRPLEDGQRVGFLATDETSYAATLREIFAMDGAERLRISEAARRAVADRFSQEAFEAAFAHRMVAQFRR